jgi:hypothetical protein
MRATKRVIDFQKDAPWAAVILRATRNLARRCVRIETSDWAGNGFLNCRRARDHYADENDERFDYLDSLVDGDTGHHIYLDVYKVAQWLGVTSIPDPATLKETWGSPTLKEKHDE